jgi:uncharacterized protein (TIGR02145 family)
MSTEALQPGVCPNCDAPGPVGLPCQERGCLLRAYHHVPRDYATWSPTRRPDPLVGRLLGRYLLVRTIGAGGFGTVYLALQQNMPSKKAAVKVLHRVEDPLALDANLKKFQGEAEAMAAISHPNVVHLLDYGRQDDAPFLVMEYVEGGRSLKEEVQDRALSGCGFSTEEVCAILRQVVDGLAAAHAKGIIHRDVKPENLMLQPVSGNPLFIRILDFGLAKFTERGTQTSKLFGTPTYMAPEQLMQRGFGPWTDLYAVGVVAFDLLTGRRPFPGHTHQEILGRKLDPDYDPLSVVSDLNLDPALIAFLRKSLAREPEARYRSGEEFRAGLEEVRRALGSTQSEVQHSGDLSALLDSEELKRLSLEKENLVNEKKKLEDERLRLLQEKTHLEEQRRRLADSQPVTPRPEGRPARSVPDEDFRKGYRSAAARARFTVLFTIIAVAIAIGATAYLVRTHPDLFREVDKQVQAVYGAVTGQPQAADGAAQGGMASRAGTLPEGAWREPDSGLLVQRVAPAMELHWADAESYCTGNRAALPGNGWRLPTLDELRALQRGCERMKPGQGCRVSGACAGWSCWTTECQGCDYDAGPSAGQYWDAALQGPSGRYWSSTLQADDQAQAWYLASNTAGVRNGRRVDTAFVRCVRAGE